MAQFFDLDAFFWLQCHCLRYMIEYIGLVMHFRNSVHKLKFLIKEREWKRREIKTTAQSKKHQLESLKKAERRWKVAVTGQLNSRQSLDSEAEHKVKTWHLAQVLYRVFEREGKRSQREAMIQVSKCLVGYLESKKKPWTCSQIPGWLLEEKQERRPIAMVQATKQNNPLWM